MIKTNQHPVSYLTNNIRSPLTMQKALDFKDQTEDDAINNFISQTESRSHTQCFMLEAAFDSELEEDPLKDAHDQTILVIVVANSKVVEIEPGRPSQADEMPLRPQLVIEPFERWALDFVGPINPSSNQRTYILVATDYVTKWVEAESFPKATEDSVIQFLFHLFVRYGLPRELITDGGPQFVGNKFAATLNNYHVHHKITTPYHPQTNAKVESSNKVIESILTKTIASHRRDWAARLPEALWAYRTTWRSTTGYSPYQLVFGKQPIFPIEFEIQTIRTAQEVSLDLSEAQINQLQQINELDAIRLSALQNTALIQQQRAKRHDALIKNKVFHKGDWALLYDSRFQHFPGKLQTRWLGPYEIQKVHDNGTLTLITIDGSGYAFKVNGHRVRLYRKPLTRESFCQ
eukprot:PITA_07728